MPEIVVLNGPPGVGKSTVTAILRTFVPGTVAISGDELRAFAPPDARAHLGGGATYRAAGALAATFLRLGAERVIFDYIFLRAAHFDYFLEALPANAAVRVCTLWAPLEIVARRAAERTAPKQLGLAAADCHREMAQNLARMGQIVDSSDVSPERCARLVHELLANAAPP